MELLARDGGGTEVAALTSLCEIEAMVELLEAIAREEGWQPGGQLGAWLQGATYFAVFVEGSLAGGIQLVRPTAGGALPCDQVWPELKSQVCPDCAHIVVFAIRKEYRARPGVLWLPCLEVWRYCRRFGIRELWLEATPSTLRVYRRLGWPLETVGEARLHWGEECVLCRVDLDEAAAAVAERACTSEFYRRLFAQACGKRPPMGCVAA